MKKLFFRLLVILMSFSLIGIILVQVYWFNNSFQNNEEEFKYHIKQVLSNIANKLQKNEQYSYYKIYNRLKDSTGLPPKKSDFLEFGYYQIDSRTNETIIYSNIINSEDYGISASFFDKKMDSIKIKNYTAKRKTEIYSENIDKSVTQQKVTPNIKIEKSGRLDLLDNAQFEIVYKDIAGMKQIQERVSIEELQKLLAEQLNEYGINTPFEFNIYSNGLATKVKSDHFKYDKKSTYSIPIFIDNDGINKYQLLITFPCKKSFLFSEFIGICILSIIFTLIILVAYSSTLNQLIRQRQISEIKTDFINNMTHEFKTPIATINLALDAIKNPKIIDDKEKVLRYLQLIKDENKRMHAQVENVLQISKLYKNELDINKISTNIHDIIEDAIEHVNLIIEDREGSITTNLTALRTTVLLNDVHFTNVLVNILDNAIKYSPEKPTIIIETENSNEYIIIKIIDQGIGMSKGTQKRIFEKFYREHTGDLHNVKGHGLGLAYVKKIIENHNSEVFVESEKGKGSTFIIKAPLIN